MIKRNQKNNLVHNILSFDSSKYSNNAVNMIFAAEI